MFIVRRFGSGFKVFGPNFKSEVIRSRAKAIKLRLQKEQEFFQSKLEDTPPEDTLIGNTAHTIITEEPIQPTEEPVQESVEEPKEPPKKRGRPKKASSKKEK